MSIENDIDNLSKWLNEDIVSDIDRKALARVLGHLRYPPKTPVWESQPACWQGGDSCPNRQACCDAQHCLYTTPPAAPMQPVAFKQFLSDVLTAAGLVTHGKQCKDLGERLGEGAMRYMFNPPAAQSEPWKKRFEWLASQHWVEPEATFYLSLEETDDFTSYQKQLISAIDAKMGIKGE